MIPLRLSLRNFMCYQDNVPPLSLAGIHVACLCGDNGNGKSALVDAITWALWGKSRARSDEDLIYSRQDEMAVELEFAASHNQYRVLRKRSRTRLGHPGHTVLELQVSTDDGFRGITGNSQDETQARIVDILHMDYQTFINSALLLQGRADEFTLKRPGERKEILASILGLSFYDELETRAKEEAERRGRAREKAEGEIEAIDRELAHKEEWRVEAEKWEGDVAQLEKRLVDLGHLLEALRHKKQSLEHKKEQRLELQERALALEEEVGRRESQLLEQRERIRGYEEVLRDREAIKQGYARLVEVRAINEGLNDRLRQWTGLKGARNEIDKEIERERSELLSEERLVGREVQGLRQQAARLPQLQQALEMAQRSMAVLEAQEKELEATRERVQGMRAGMQTLESKVVQLNKDMEELRDKLALLAKGEATCPLCGAGLGEEGRQRIQEGYKAEGRDKRESLRLNQMELESGRKECYTLEQGIRTREQEINRRKAETHRRCALAEKAVAEGQEASRQLPEREGKLAVIAQRLGKGEFALAGRARLQKVAQDLAQLDYDEEGHDAVRQELAKLRGYEERHRRLEVALGTLAQETRVLAELEGEVGKKRDELQQEKGRAAKLVEEISGLGGELLPLAGLEQELRTLLEQQRLKRQELWGVQERLRRCLELETLRVVKRQEADGEAREVELYEELVRAFSKRGAQALLIEKALPEITVEADRLLAQMTENRLHLDMVTQRGTKKKGGVIETLDIIISDELGTRSYEMFSGGEAFRINFALRIALAKLLARRAGAPLSTLIIDEGFGTQDVVGRERVIEAINSVQGDFEKILVMTHIEELKDAFPVRINVVKTAQGSTLYLS